MTIDDELLLEIIKPDRAGKCSTDALLFKIINDKQFVGYKLEEDTIYYEHYSDGNLPSMKVEPVTMTPDITVLVLQGGGKSTREIAIEVENGYKWDFQESLRQVKKYQKQFLDVRMVIPEEYRRFAPLLKNEYIRVFLWKAKRKWQCLRCGTETVKEGPISPKCSCNNNNQNDFRLIGLVDTNIEEFT
jgi:hypothetical protein